MARQFDDEDDQLPSYWEAVKILKREIIHANGLTDAEPTSTEFLRTRPDVVAIFPPSRNNSTCRPTDPPQYAVHPSHRTAPRPPNVRNIQFPSASYFDVTSNNLQPRPQHTSPTAPPLTYDNLNARTRSLDNACDSSNAGQELLLADSSDSTSLLPVELERDIYMIHRKPTQTNINWNPPLNIENYSHVCYVIQMFKGKPSSYCDEDAWQDIHRCMSREFRIYRMGDMVLLGKTKINKPSPTEIKLRIKTVGQSIVTDKEETSWSVAFTVRITRY